MPRRKPDPRFRHGPSEAASRPAVAGALVREQRRLATRLRALRTERGLSQEAAAEAMGVHAKHVQRLESGSVNVTLRTLVAAGLAYKVTLAELFSAERPGAPKQQKQE